MLRRRYKKNRMKRNIYNIGLAVTAIVALAVLLTASAAGSKFSAWSAPVNLGPAVNSSSIEFGPAISKDGLSLYISSTHPGGFGGEDIWVSQRTSSDDAWGQPVNLGSNINTSDREFVPNFSRDGHWMFFTSNRPGGFGAFDNWVSWRAHTHDDFGWQQPVNLGPAANSSGNDLAPHYFENEGGIPNLFFTSGRAGGVGDLDNYVSALTIDGSFGPAVLIRELSTPQRDARPNLRHDGLEIFLFESSWFARGS
jgi:hypothetical protein